MSERNVGEKKELFPATIAALIDEKRIVINRGSQHDIKIGQRFLVYTLSDEIIKDPETQEDLGRLEITKGTGKVIHVQDRMAIIESDQRSPSTRKIYRSPWQILYYSPDEITEFPGELLPFKDAKVGDKVKPI